MTSATGRKSRRCSTNWKDARRDCQTAADLERWLLDWSELNAALDEESSRRYIAMTCHTDSADAEKAYLHFVENVEPQLKPRQFALEKIYVAHPLRGIAEIGARASLRRTDATRVSSRSGAMKFSTAT